MRKKISSKYKANIKTEYEPGTKDHILKNRLGIKNKSDLNEKEFNNYIKAEEILINKFDLDHVFKIKDIHLINKIFLGDIYDWAGKLRDVNISKGGFNFASAFALPEAMNEFEKNVLKINTPCKGEKDIVSKQIAEVHTELLILHPYREGNGRTARLLATLMSYQAGYPGIDFSFIKSKGKEFNKYINAVQNGMENNYEPMIKIIKKGLSLSLKNYEKWKSLNSK